MQVGRNKSLKIPRQIKFDKQDLNTTADEVQTRKAFAIAENKKFNQNKETKDIETRDSEWEQI